MKQFARLLTLIICLIFIVQNFSSCGLSSRDKYRARITDLVLSNKTTLDKLALEILEQGRKTGNEIKVFYYNVNNADYKISYLNMPAINGDPFQNEYVKFSVDSVGLVSNSTYYDFYYSPSDVPFRDDSLTRLSDSPDSASQTKYGYGWIWSGQGDNYGYTERICENWFYSDAHF